MTKLTEENIVTIFVLSDHGYTHSEIAAILNKQRVLLNEYARSVDELENL